MKAISVNGAWTCYETRRYWILKNRGTGEVKKTPKREWPNMARALTAKWGYRDLRVPEDEYVLYWG